VADSRRPSRSRFVVEASTQRSRSSPTRSASTPRSTEVWVAISVIVAAALATFLALFLTSRPFDPTSASLNPQQVVPAGPAISPSPKTSPTGTPALASQTPAKEASPTTPGGETSTDTPNDATIQSHIESTLASDPNLAKLDVSTLVEGGKVTIVGSVRSVELKQRVEKAIRSVKGVTGVDNQLVITEATP
jgi:BON domain-containing protein